MQKLRYLYNARIFLHKIFCIYSAHISSQQYLAKWHGIKLYVRFLLINSLRYLTFSSMLFSADRYLAFVPLLTHARKPIYRLLSPSKASNPFPEILQQLFNIKNNVPTMSRSKLYLRTIFYL